MRLYITLCFVRKSKQIAFYNSRYIARSQSVFLELLFDGGVSYKFVVHAQPYADRFSEPRCDCFADDTGLEVEALGGAPGVHSARYATDGHDFAANNELLLRNLEGVGNRRARFRTVISLILDGEEHLFEGIVEGHIAQCASGSEGFGYDPLFIPEGSAKTYAEMDPAEKNALSHRGRAVRKLAEFLHNRGK